jgi:hypothetical protein
MLDSLIGLAVGHIGGGEPEMWRSLDIRGYEIPVLPTPSWAAPLNAGADDPTMQLWFSWSDDGDCPDEPRHQPIAIAALVFDRATERCRIAIRDGLWPRPASAFTDQRQARISEILYLNELATAGITLTEQAEHLGVWARSAFERLAALEAPVVSAKPDSNAGAMTKGALGPETARRRR